MKKMMIPRMAVCMVRSNECMRIGQINAQSIYAKSDMLRIYLANNDVNVMLLSETWVRENKTFRMNGYSFLSRPRADGYGGVAILARDNIMLSNVGLPNFEYIEAIAAKTRNLDRNLIIVSMYVTPFRNVCDRGKILRDFRKFFDWVHGKSDMIVGGDMNAHSRMWGCENNDECGNLLADLVLDSDLVILNDGRPTKMANVRANASAIDITLVSSGLAAQVTWNVTDENLGSDHYLIETCLGGVNVEVEKKARMNGKKWVRCMDEILMSNELNNADQLECAIERVNDVCVSKVRMKEIKVHAWWNNEIQYWYDRKRVALREFNRCICSECRLNYERMNGRLKKAIRRAKRNSWRNYVSEMTHRTTTKDVWEKFNRVRGKQIYARNAVLDDRENGNQFLQMMMDVRNNLGGLYICMLTENVNQSMNEMCVEFDWNEFLRVLETAKLTTPGINRVSYRMIVQLSFEAKVNLLRILNNVWMSIQIPEKWKESRVVPIPKRDRDLNVATNYRGICMLNVFIKIVNGMLKGRIEKFMSEHNLLPETTFGFRRNHSANECVEKFVWEVRKEKKYVAAVFLDIERAYDYVVSGKMYQVLVNLSFPEKICKWVYAFMSDRKLVLCGKNYRLEGAVNIGLPQGSKISPLLFNLYTSSIHQYNSEDTVILQFADDFVLMGKGNNFDQARNRVQGCVNQVTECLKDLNLRVNTRKCYSMTFRTNKRIDVRIYNESIECVNVTRYLGIWIDKRMNFKVHMEKLADNCKSRLNVIKRVSKPKWGAHPSVTDMIRKALVSSKIAYGMSVYGDGSKVGFDRLMKVENACIRVVLGAINSTPIHSLWSEMGDSPLNYKREWIIVRETVRMLQKNKFLVNDIIARLQEGTVYQETARSRVILENINIFSKIRQVSPIFPPGNLVVCLNFGDLTKAQMNELSVKREFRKMQMGYFAHVEVYTDASVNGNRVGVGIFIPSMKKEKMVRINDSICIMNAELIGIMEGIKLALNEGRRRVIIFSDSLSGLKLISRGGGSQGNVYVEILCEYIRSCGSEVILQWIPSHLQIEGNERADMLAKRGCMLEEVTGFEFMDARDVLRVFQMNLWEKWKNEFVEKSQVKGKKYFEWCSAPLKIPFYKESKGDTTMIRTMERVRLNHGNWKECLKKRHLSEDDLCDSCLVVEDIEHLILKCSKYAQSRQMFSGLMNARNLTELLRMGTNEYRMMYEFIRINGIIV